MDCPFMCLSGASQLSYVSPATSWEFATAENLLSSCKKCLWLMMMTMLFFLSKAECERKSRFSWHREKTNLWYGLTSGSTRRSSCAHGLLVRARGSDSPCPLMTLFMLPPLCVCVCSEIPHLSPCVMIPISITFASELYSVLLERKEIMIKCLFFFKVQKFVSQLSTFYPSPTLWGKKVMADPLTST